MSMTSAEMSAASSGVETPAVPRIPRQATEHALGARAAVTTVPTSSDAREGTDHAYVATSVLAPLVVERTAPTAPSRRLTHSPRQLFAVELAVVACVGLLVA